MVSKSEGGVIVSKAKADGGGGGRSVMPLRGETLKTARGDPGCNSPKGNS